MTTRLIEEPKLSSPPLLAGWPGMGLVAFKTISYLIEKTDATLMAEFEGPDLFPVRGININEGLVEETRLPTSQLYYVKQPHTRDLLLFLGEEQPVSGKEWVFTNDLLDVVEAFGCGQVYTFAAMPRNIHHRASPGVSVVATSKELLRQIQGHGIRVLREGQVTGLNGLLLGVARHRGMAGCCLLGEIPLYTTQIHNPRTSIALLTKLEVIAGVRTDLSDLQSLAQITEMQLDIYVKHIQARVAEASEEQREEDGSHKKDEDKKKPTLLN